MIQRAVLIAAALLLATPCYAQKTSAQLNTEISTQFPDQDQGLITPQNLRNVTSDIVNSIMPTAPVVNGNNVCFNGTTGLLKDCGTAPPGTQLANTFFAAPNGSSGTPSFRLQVLADLPSTGNASSLLANPTGSPGAPSWVTLDPTLSFSGSTLKCTTFGSSQAGCVPASGGGTTSFMRADGTWATPAGGGNVTGPGSSTAGHFVTFNGASGTVIQDQATVTTNTQDLLFGSGRPWCDVRAQGAVGNGSTDDSAAFNACVTQCITTKSYGACTIYVPPSSATYCIKNTINLTTGLTTNGGFRLIGAGVQGAYLDACGTNVNILNMNAQWIEVAHITVLGYGSRATDAVFTGSPPSGPAILMGTLCSNCKIHDVYVTGGTAAIQNNGACGYTIENVWGSFSYGDGAHTFGFFTQINCGGTIFNDHFDMVYPVSQPAHGSSISAWASAHAYTAGTIVSVTCNSRTFYIQAVNSGTSAGSAPNCKPFGATITDNTQNWLLVNAATSYCIQLDTGSIETEVLMTDATCAANYNIGFTNTYAGTPPSQNSLIRSTPGGGFSGNIYMNSGTHNTLIGMETSYCMLTGCAGVLMDNAVVSLIKISDLDCLNGFSYCVNVTGAATHFKVSGMQSSGADTADFSVSAASSGFMLVNSEHTSGAANLFTIAAVAADHYVIANNVCNSASSSDGGTGTHKSIVPAGGCNGTNP